MSWAVAIAAFVATSEGDVMGGAERLICLRGGVVASLALCIVAGFAAPPCDSTAACDWFPLLQLVPFAIIARALAQRVFRAHLGFRALRHDLAAAGVAAACTAVPFAIAVVRELETKPLGLYTNLFAVGGHEFPLVVLVHGTCQLCALGSGAALAVLAARLNDGAGGDGAVARRTEHGDAEDAWVAGAIALIGTVDVAMPGVLVLAVFCAVAYARRHRSLAGAVFATSVAVVAAAALFAVDGGYTRAAAIPTLSRTTARP